MQDNAKMMLFSFIAYYDFLQQNAEDLEESVNKMLISMQEHLKFSDVCWGPVANKTHEVLTDSLIFVVKNNNNSIDEYTVVIRGTNPLSIQSWLFQDLNVSGQVPWSRQSPFTSSQDAYISKATDTSLMIHKNLQCGNATLLEWLISIIDQEKNGKIKLNICGHSLGGLMATTLAMWLFDELTEIRKMDSVDLSVYSYAGPTAGNDKYVDYVNSKIGNKYVSVNNYYDIVPYVWKEEDTYRILTDIYGDLKMSQYEKDVYDKLCEDIRKMNYEKLGNVVDVKSEILSDFTQDYLIQASVQHVLPYLVYTLSKNPIVSVEVFFTLLMDIIRDLVKDTEDIWNKVFGIEIESIDHFRNKFIDEIMKLRIISV